MDADHEFELNVVEEVFVDGELAELIVIEEFAKRGERPPHAKTYVIRIDKETYHVHKADPTGEELLQLAGKSSASFKIYQVFRGRQPEPVGPNEKVDLRQRSEGGRLRCGGAASERFPVGFARRRVSRLPWTSVGNGPGRCRCIAPVDRELETTCWL
jgi:hypothetical protein